MGILRIIDFDWLPSESNRRGIYMIFDKIYGKCDCCGKTITNVWDYSSEYDNGIKTYCLNCSEYML